MFVRNKPLIIYTGPVRFPNQDAAAIRVLNNAKVLMSLNYEVLVLSWGGIYLSDDLHEDGNYYHLGVRYIITDDIDIKRNQFLKRLFYLAFTGQKSISILKKLLVIQPIVIGYNIPLYFTMRMLLFRFRFSFTYLSDLTEWYNGEMFPGGKYCFPAFFNYVNMHFVQRYVSNKILISSYLNDFYYHSNNLIIPPLIDITENKSSKNSENYDKGDELRFVYVGIPASLNDIKDNLEMMINNFLTFIEDGVRIQLNIVGVSYVDIQHYGNYKRIVAANNKIILHGRIRHDLVSAIFAKSDFSLVYRSKCRKNMAGFPTKLSESLAASCPVITSNISDVSNYIIDGFNGYILQNDSTAEFERVIYSILKLNRSEVNVMKDNAYETALNKLSCESYNLPMKNFLNRISKLKINN